MGQVLRGQPILCATLQITTYINQPTLHAHLSTPQTHFALLNVVGTPTFLDRNQKVKTSLISTHALYRPHDDTDFIALWNGHICTRRGRNLC